MGAPGWTSFCENGHIIEECQHHQIIDDQMNICEICNSPIIGIETEWGDSDYGPFNVPETPIGFDTVEVKESSKYGVKTFPMKIPIYDVSKLKK